MILLTGGTGLVGSHLLYELTAAGKRVRALKRNGSQTDIVEKIFAWYNPQNYARQLELIEWAEGNISDIFSLKEALQGVKQVYHCAAVVSFVPSERPQMLKINIEGTANLINACLGAQVEKFCHCSSIAAVGRPDKGIWVDESLIWKTSRKNSYYSISKFGAEREVWRGSEEGLNVVIVNPSVIIGPGDPNRSSARLFTTVKNGLRFYSAGATGFVDVRDVAGAMHQLMDAEIVNERYILNSENISYKKLFEIFARHAGVKPPFFKAGRVLSEIAWRLEKIRSVVTGSNPLITKETARSASSRYCFSNEKISRELAIQFRTVEESAANTAGFFQKFGDFN
ncbi:MAG: NAD-dependent epimerase/dehydratase family protein [Bacteroidales bacterium]